MIGWLLLGLVLGFAGGFAVAWFLRRQPAAERAEPAAGPAIAPETSLAEPVPPVAERADEEIHQALDATKGLLDELEERYRGRTAPPEERKPARRRPRK